jgi:hypothetical protein
VSKLISLRIHFQLFRGGATGPLTTTATATVVTGANTSTIALAATADTGHVCTPLLTHVPASTSSPPVNGKAGGKNGSGIVLQETGFSLTKESTDQTKVSFVDCYKLNSMRVR